MKFYVASKFENTKNVKAAIAKLTEAGHTVTYDWTKALTNNNEDEALKCVGGVRDADFIVALLQRSLKYKGTIAEIGMAIALNKRICIIGDFIHLDHIEKFSSIDEIIFQLHKDYSPEMQRLASEPEIEVVSIEGNIMKIQIKTAQGYLCFAPSQDFNPDGTPKPEGKICIEYRPTGGGWQDIEIVDLDNVFTQMCKFVPSTTVPPVTPPPDGGTPPDTSGYPITDPGIPSLRPPYKCPTSTDFKNAGASDAFIKMGHQVGYGPVLSDDLLGYWREKKIEMLQRGVELAMVPPEKYWWERLMGRGAGGADTATQGPYKGMEHYEGSLTP